MHNNRYSISRKIVIIVSLMVTSLSLYSQSWSLVWREDFGVAEDTVIKDFADPTMKVEGHYFYANAEKQGEVLAYDPVPNVNREIVDGTYGIANSVKWAYTRFTKSSDILIPGRDHTGNQNGAMLIVNSGAGIDKEIYSQDIVFDLCDAKKYRFGLYTASVCHFGELEKVAAALTLQIFNKKDGKLIDEVSTGDIPLWTPAKDPHTVQEWSFYSIDFVANNGDELQLKVINHKPSGDGNDFVIDDISLFRYDEDVEIPEMKIEESAIASSTTNNSCSYEANFTVVNSVLEAWQKIDNAVYILWQKSNDDGLTWTNLTTESGLNKYKLSMSIDGTETSVFRVIVTASPTESEAKEQAEYIATHNAPKNGCAYYSISNTISSIKPEPNCTYKESLREIWKEDFGLCDTFSFGSNSGIVLEPYISGGKERMGQDGTYLICSIPDSAVYYMRCDWDGSNCKKAYQFNDGSYNSGDASKLRPAEIGNAFAFVRMNRTNCASNSTIFKKTVSLPICPCKTFMFNASVMCNGSEWGTTIVPKMTITDKDGNELGAESVELKFTNGFSKKRATVPFSVPMGYSGDITLELSLDYDYNNGGSRCADWSDIGIDDLSVTICGEAMPKPTLSIDGIAGLHLLSGFECTDETPHKIIMTGMNDVIKEYPNAAFVWQSSIDGGKTWKNLTESATSVNYAYTGDSEILYRAIVGDSKITAEEVAAKGKPNDACSVFHITNTVGFLCKESGCKAPIYQIDGDTVAEVCSDQSKAVKIVAVQQNTVKTDSKQWYSKPFNETSWTAITGATNETLEVSTLPADSTDYLFLAVNDTCTSDSVLFRLNVHQAITLEPLEDTILCMGKDIDIKAIALTGVPTKYIWNINPALTTEKLSLTSVAAEQSISVYATDGVCKSMPAEMDITVETPISFTDVDEINVCEGYQFIIDPKAGGDIKNIIWTRTDSEGNVKTLTDKEGETTLEEVAQESATYGFKLQGNKCPTEIASVKVNVNPIPTITIEVSAEKICSGEDLSFTSEMTNAATVQYFYQVEGGTTIEQFGLSHNVVGETLDQNPTANAKYWAIIPSDGYCPLVSTDTFFVEVEQPLDFKISDIPTSICAGSEVVNLEATLISGEPLGTKWTSGSEVLTNELTTTDSPTAATTYTFTAHGDKCSPVESPFTKTYTVDVEKAANLTLTSSDDTICAGASLTLTAEYGDATSLTWESSTDGSHFTSFSAEITSTQAQTPTATTHYRLMTAGSGKCAQVPSNTVTVEVEQPLVFEISSNTPATICSGTPVNLSASVTEGTPTSYSWSNGETILSTESTITDTPEKSTTYELTITANKCTVSPQSISLEVETVDNLTLAANSAKICKGTNVTLTATYGNASTLSWEVSTDGTNFTEESTLLAESRDVTPIATSTYRLKTAGKVCEPVYSDPVTIQVEQPIEFTLTPTPVTVCAGDLVTLSATLTNGEATSYSWTKDGNPFVSELTTSDSPTSDVGYALSIKGDQCEAVTHSTSISVEQPVHLTLSTSNDTICQGGSVTLSAGYETSNSLEWESSADKINYTPFSQELTETQEVTPTTTTFYRLKTSGTGACKQTFSDTVEVAVEMPIVFTIQPTPATICEGTVVNLTAEQTSGEAKTITWKVNGTPFANTLQTTHQPTDETTNYELEIEGNTCSPLSKSVSVTMEKQPSLELSLSKTAVCKDTIVTLNLKHENCKGLSWKRKTAGSDSFSEFMQEMTDTYQLTANETTTFIVEATGNQACRPQPTNEVTLTVEQPVSVSLSGDQMICPGDHATITATVGGAPTTTQWYKQDMSDSDFSLADMRGATVQVSPTRTTHYKLVANANYCPKADAEVTITVDEVPTLNISTSQNRICEGDELTVSTTFDYEPNITWTAETGNTSETIANGQKELSLFPTETTTYKVTAFSQANCPAGELSAKVIVDKAIVANLEDKDICQGDSVEIKCYGSPAYQYTWTSGNDNISQNSSVVVKPEETTSYNVKIVNGVCEETLETAITVHKLPQILSCEEISNKTYQMVAESDNQPLTYDFGNGKGATLSDVIENITYGRSYHITVTDNIGCQSDTTVVTPSYDVIIPEYFNPENGEGWKITNIERFNNTTISIFDRFGKKLVELKGEDIEGWNGTYNGHDMPSTDYWYVVAIGELDRIYTGHFTLIR